MPKTEAEVIAKLQRRLENTGRHITGLIDTNAGQKKQIHELEDLLVWIYKRLVEEDHAFQPQKEVRETIKRTIPRALARKEAGE